MFPGINPKKMQQMMKQMGISQDEINAERVIIETIDTEPNIIIENPSVSKVTMQGQEQFQITGDITEETVEEVEEGISEEDIQAVIEKTQCSEEQAKSELEKTNNDIAEAIINLS